MTGETRRQRGAHLVQTLFLVHDLCEPPGFAVVDFKGLQPELAPPGDLDAVIDLATFKARRGSGQSGMVEYIRHVADVLAILTTNMVGSGVIVILFGSLRTPSHAVFSVPARGYGLERQLAAETGKVIAMVLKDINGRQHQAFFQRSFSVGYQPPATLPYLRIEQSSVKPQFESLGRLPGTPVPACRRVSCRVARSPHRTAMIIGIASSFRCR